MLRNVRLLYIHYALSDFRPQEAFLIIYFSRLTGSYMLAMAVLSAATLTSALLDIPTGILSDKIGRRLTLVLASLSVTLGVGCFALATGVAALFAGGILCGLGQCLFNGNNNALLFESLKSAGREGDYHHYLGRSNSMYQLGLCSSALLGAVLAAQYDLRLIFALGVVPQILSVVVSLMFEEPRVHQPHQLGSWAHFKVACAHIAQNPRLFWLMMADAISYGAGESNFNFKTAFVNSLWPTWAVGIYKGLTHALSAISAWFAGRIIDTVKGPYVLVARDLYWFVSAGLGVLLSNAASPLLFMSGSPFYIPARVAKDQLLQKEFTDAQRATLGSVGSFAGSMIYALAALAIGAIADQFSLGAGVMFGIGACALSLPIYIGLFRREF
jgi:MFS family permease